VKKLLIPLRVCLTVVFLFACTLHQTRVGTQSAPTAVVTDAAVSLPNVTEAAAALPTEIASASNVVVGATAGANDLPPDFEIAPPAPPEVTDIVVPPGVTEVTDIVVPPDVAETSLPAAAQTLAAFNATSTALLLPPTVADNSIPVVTVLPTEAVPLPTLTGTVPATPLVPTIAVLPTLTASVEQAATVVPSLTSTPQPTSAPELPTITPSPQGTQPLFTLTPPSVAGAQPAAESGDAPLSAVTGWTCDDFPCEDDLNGFLERIQVPLGYHVEHLGRFPGQPLQITYGQDGRLYATVLENGTRSGAVYVMDAEGGVSRYSGEFISPLGLAFQPGTDTLYVSARMTLEQGGGVWRVPYGGEDGGGEAELVVANLPCCYNAVSNQPNGMIFGQDGYLYLGVGSLTDATINPPRSAKAYADVLPNEAAILRIHPHTGAVGVFAQGIRNPYDLAVDSSGQLYATDNGLVTGQGDRLLKVDQGARYGWPYWRSLGCENCPLDSNRTPVSPNLLDFPLYTRPRGLVAYTGTQFPSNMFDSLFVTLWNGVEGGQRVIRVEPSRVGEADYTPEAFVTGLIRPTDVAIAPDGALVVADYVYGHIWRVVYDG
jgi:sugar lactone lactonase YvrE